MLLLPGGKGKVARGKQRERNHYGVTVGCG